MTTSEDFFKKPEPQSIVKTEIVAKYFHAWTKVIIPSVKRNSRSTKQIAYVDLFAGQGKYEDGTKSTPLLILEQAINDPDLQQMLVTVFNDADSQKVESLKAEVEKLNGINLLKYKPQILNLEVGDEIVEQFEQINFVPTLFFIDPWGYKGLSLDLISTLLQGWGCDCIIFFNYFRVLMGLSNPKVSKHMDSLFGVQRTSALRNHLKNMTAPNKNQELVIIEELVQALKQLGGKFVLPFRFRNAKGTCTSHHLIFVSKHSRGYEIMKEIMANESSGKQQGVASFEYNVATREQPFLFELAKPLDDLCDMILDDLAGQELTMREIYEKHSIDRRYIKKNYKDALMKLEEEGRIKAEPPASKRKKGTFADTVLVTIPPKREK